VETLAEMTAVVSFYVRKGVLGLYIAIAVPWAAWFAYEAYDSYLQQGSAYGFLRSADYDRLTGRPTAYNRAELLEWAAEQDSRHISALRALPTVPIGGLLLYLVVAWGVARFRNSAPQTNAA
jgi:hypothetical protein